MLYYQHPTNSTIGADIKKIARTSREILEDLDRVVRELRTEMDQDRHRIDRKLRGAAIGAIALGAVAFLLPDQYQDRAEALVTYASFGAALGVLLG